MTDRNTVEEQFYQDCEMLLNAGSQYRKFPYSKRTRWNNRQAGNGRFEGFGLVRMFSPSCIHVAFHTPKINKTYNSIDEVLELLHEIIRTR